MWGNQEEMDLLQCSLSPSGSDNESSNGLTCSSASTIASSPSISPQLNDSAPGIRRRGTLSCRPPSMHGFSRSPTASSTSFAMSMSTSRRSSSHPTPTNSAQRTGSPFSRSGSFSSECSAVIETGVAGKGEDEDGFKTVNQYTHLHEIGKGSYAKVKLVLDGETEDVRAMKIMRKSLLEKKGAMGNVRREIALLKKMEHKNIVRLHEVIDDNHEDKVFLIFEYLEKGELIPLGTDGTTGGVVFDFARTRQAMIDIVEGIAFLHEHLIYHRDIKPANLLLDKDGSVKVADLGVAIAFSSEEEASRMHGSEGTPAFLPPEVAKGGRVINASAVDIWAMGVTMYVMLHGRLPFYGETMKEVSTAICESPLIIAPEVDDVAAELLDMMLMKDPAERITMAELKEHAFFCGEEEEPFESCIGRITVTEEDIENSLTSRKWKRLALMVVQVQEQLKTINDMVKREEEMQGKSRRRGIETLFTRVRSTLKTIHKQATTRSLVAKVELLMSEQESMEASFRSFSTASTDLRAMLAFEETSSRHRSKAPIGLPNGKNANKSWERSSTCNLPRRPPRDMLAAGMKGLM